MQKKIIALAVAGLVSGAAFAQSNVTIYGVADATFESVKASSSSAGGNAFDFDRRNRVTSNSNFIGFKGTEDLGNGLKAVWQFENGLNTDGTAGVWNNRDSFVGLSSGMGTVVMGNLTTPVRAIGAKLDVNSGATGIGANTALLAKLGGTLGENGASQMDQRTGNAIAYVSPTYSGFNATVAYSAGTTQASGLAMREASGANGADGLNGNTAWALGANYDNGPLYVGYGYTRVNATNNGAAAADGIAATIDSLRTHRVGAIYKLGTMGQIGFLWDNTRAEVSGGSNLKQNVWYLSGKYNLSANGTLIGQFGHAGDVSGNGNGVDQSAKHWMIGYEHALSKRTILKAGYSKISNDNAASYDFLYGVSSPNTTATAAGMTTGTSVSGFFAGMRHSF